MLYPSDKNILPEKVILTREQWEAVRDLFRRRPEVLDDPEGLPETAA